MNIMNRCLEYVNDIIHSLNISHLMDSENGFVIHVDYISIVKFMTGGNDTNNKFHAVITC